MPMPLVSPAPADLALTAPRGRGEVAITEAEQADCDVRVTGSQDDWIDALGPEADRSGLRIDGDERLAAMLLDGLGVVAEDAARGERVA